MTQQDQSAMKGETKCCGTQRATCLRHRHQETSLRTLLLGMSSFPEMDVTLDLNKLTFQRVSLPTLLCSVEIGSEGLNNILH